MPPARFDFFVTSLSMEAFIGLGLMANPRTGETAKNLPQAKYLIDILGVLQEKTKGNLEADEEKLLQDALTRLRLAYLEASKKG